MFGNNGCDYCNDLRCIEPAKYVWCDDEETQAQILEARDNKQFIGHFYEDGLPSEDYIMIGCPECGYVFTEEDYDSYWD